MPVIMFGNKELLGLIVDTAGQLVAIKYFNICASEWVLFVGFNLPWMYEELTSISIIYINYSFCFSPFFMKRVPWIQQKASSTNGCECYESYCVSKGWVQLLEFLFSEVVLHFAVHLIFLCLFLVCCLFFRGSGGCLCLHLDVKRG